MGSRYSPLAGAVKEPVCSRAAEHSKKAASLDASELNNLAILTKRQAAAIVQTSPRYLERMVASGRLRAYRPTGKLWRVRRKDLDAFLESGATIGGGPQ
jgi:excisionase family DNA binding protein